MDLRKLFNRLVNANIQQNVGNSYDMFRAQRFNMFLIICFLFFFFNQFIAIYYKLTYSFLIQSFLLVIFLVCYFLPKPKYYQFSLYLTIFGVAIFLSIINIVEGYRFGDFMGYFPFVVVLGYLVNFKSKTQVIVLYGLWVLSGIITILFITEKGYLQDTSAELARDQFISSTTISLLLVCFFSVDAFLGIKKRQDQVDNDRLLLQTIFNSARDAIFLLDAKSFRINNANKIAADMLDKAHPDLLLTIQFNSFFVGQKDEKELKEDALLKASLQAPVLVQKKYPNAEEVFYGSLSTEAFEYLGQQLYKVSVLDITQQKIAEIELLASKEKAEVATVAKTRFLSNMSHELRTPLNAIVGTTNLLLHDETPVGLAQQYTTLQYASEQMLGIINDVLDLNKIEAGKLILDRNTFNLKETIEKVVSIFKPQFTHKKIDFIVHIDSQTDCSIVADDIRIRQVITNLLSNALKFTMVGYVQLKVQVVAKKSESIQVDFIVSDSGIGVAPDKQKSIFTSFTQADLNTTRKFGGTGLGLTICKMIVEKMGGDIHLQSEEFKGSTFSFNLDLSINSSKNILAKKDSATKLESLENLQVLIAEDNLINMSVATRFLQVWNVNYKEAYNGLEAVNLFKTNQFDLLLIDLEMPEMDGYAAIEEIRKMDAKIPAIAFTAAMLENMEEHLMNKGFSGYCSKPFKPSDLHSKLKEVYAMKHLESTSV